MPVTGNARAKRARATKPGLGPRPQPLATVGQKGQIVIPIALRRQLGLQAGQEVEMIVENGQIIVKPLPVDLIAHLTGSLKAPGKTMLQEHLEEHVEEMRRDEEASA